MELNKKAQGRTFWIVITAVIALVVLVVLLMIFTGKIGMLDTGLMSCEGKGGDCSVAKGGECPPKFTESKAFTCENDEMMCCLGVKESE